MNTVKPQESLSEVLDQIIREVTPLAAGIDLSPSQAELNGELYTVYITFLTDFHTSLSLCAETALFTRLAQHMMMSEEVTPEEVEISAKEYLNILCGHIMTQLFPDKKRTIWFGVPAFYQGRYTPEGQYKHIVLTYSNDKDERIQLVHHVPGTAEQLCKFN